MKQYEKYKDSGVEWLGKIPEHWKQSKLKYEFYIKARVGWKGLKSDEFQQNSYAYLVTGTDFKDVEINWKNCYQIDEFRYNDDPFIQLMNGDLLITKDGTIGKTSFVRNLDKPACLNSGIFVLRQIKDTTVDFFYWLLNSSIFHDFNKLTVSGSTIQHLYQNIFENFIFSVPKKEEQQAISLYLNHITSAIDLLIKEKESLISKLQEKCKALINEVVTKGLNPNVPMRDSGIEWLGMIPEHWGISKIKFLADLKSGTNLTSEVIEPDGDFPVYGGNGLRGFYGSYTDEGHYILIGRQGALCGNINYAKGQFWATEHAVVCYPKLDFKTIWFGELLRAMNLNQYSIASAQPGLAVERIKNLAIPVPSTEEQAGIVDFIESRTTKIEQTISEIQIQIQKLKEYKTSVISEAVTGKVDVREWKQKNN